MGGISVKLEGLDKLLAQTKLAQDEIAVKLVNNLNEFGTQVKATAIRNLSREYPLGATDNGFLKNHIEIEIATKEKLNVNVVVASNYAAYVEFGTKKFAAKYVATLPQDWQAFAAKFKGKGGGSLDDFLKRIHEWVMRKGFAAYETKSGGKSGSKNSLQAQESAAYIIALRILQNGIHAHPFLYPAYVEAKKTLEDNLKQDFK